MLWSITYNNNQYIAVGNSGTIFSSIDNGITWESQNSATNQDLRIIIYGDMYVILGANGGILLSNDGITWEPYSIPITSQILIGGTYANGQYIGVGTAGTIAILNNYEWNIQTFGIKNLNAIVINN